MTSPTHPTIEPVSSRVPTLGQDIAALTKSRLTTLVLITTLVGFLFGSPQGVNWLLLIHAMLGTGLVAAGAAALNQLMEIPQDRLMSRTADRPLPAGRMTPSFVLIFGLATNAIGLLYLGLAVNLLAAAFALLTSLTYLLLYTPLKQRTIHNTLIGAVSGALPPVIGWAAATNRLGIESFILFGILFFWQMPHFLAIAWIYRAQYEGAGFRMWPSLDQQGPSTANQAILYAVGLLGITLLPCFLGLNNPVHLVLSLLLGGLILWLAIVFRREMTNPAARRLFLATLLYLPLILLSLILTMR